MDFGKFLLSKRSLFAIFFRLALYLTPFTKRVSNLPFVSSSFSSYDKLKEAFFFIENGHNPYEIEHIFQKPLTTLIFYQLRMSEFATVIVFILFDLLIAHLLEQDVFTKRNLQQTEKSKQNTSTWSMIYLFNPITIYNCLTLSTQSLDYLLALTSIYYTFNKSILVGSTIFGAALYQNPQMALIFPVLFLASKSTEKRHTQTSSIDITTIILSVIISLVTFGGLCYLSFLVTQSWSFFEACYYRIFFLNYFEPNLSLAWNLHTSMFNKYRDLYFATLALFQLFMILPLYLLFKKFLLSKKAQAGYIGVLSGFCFAVIVMLGPSTTLYDFAFCMTMLCMQIEILYRIKFIILFDHVFIFALLGAGYTTYSWKNSFTAEPSWIFLQTAVFYGCYVATLSEVLTSIRHETLESEPATENINPSI